MFFLTRDLSADAPADSKGYKGEVNRGNRKKGVALDNNKVFFALYNLFQFSRLLCFGKVPVSAPPCFPHGSGCCVHAPCPSAGLSPSLPAPHVQERSGGTQMPGGRKQRGGHGEEVCGLRPTGRSRTSCGSIAGCITLCGHDAILPAYFIILWWAMRWSWRRGTWAVNLQGGLSLQRHKKSGVGWGVVVVVVVIFNTRQFNCQVAGHGWCDQAVFVVVAEHGSR